MYIFIKARFWWTNAWFVFKFYRTSDGTSKFLGVQCTPLTLHLGVQWKLTAFSPRKVVHHAVFCKYYAELAKTFFFKTCGHAALRNTLWLLSKFLIIWQSWLFSMAIIIPRLFHTELLFELTDSLELLWPHLHHHHPQLKPIMTKQILKLKSHIGFLYVYITSYEKK
jgi:hypothetical protein